MAEELVDRALTAEPARRIKVHKADFPPVAAATVLNVSATILPGILLLVVDDWRLALNASKWMVVLMMFSTGFLWGRTTGFGGWRSGLAMLAFGVTMVSVAVLFGG